MKSTVLFLFNASDYAPAPWIARGHHCTSVDFSDTDHSAHRDALRSTPEHERINLDLSQEDALGALREALRSRGLEPRVALSYCPCTNLAVSGAAHFAKKRKANERFQEEAVEMARLVEGLGIPFCVENPVSVLSTLWRKPDVVTNPASWGGYCPEGEHPEAPELYPPQDAYNKKTCYWTGLGFSFPEERPVEVKDAVNPGHRALGGKSARTKHLRSLTPRGVSEAMAVANEHFMLEVNT